MVKKTGHAGLRATLKSVTIYLFGYLLVTQHKNLFGKIPYMILFGIKPVDNKGYRATKRRQFTFYTDFSKLLGAHMKVFLIKRNVMLFCCLKNMKK